jgi:hypothetical protein
VLVPEFDLIFRLRSANGFPENHPMYGGIPSDTKLEIAEFFGKTNELDDNFAFFGD